MKYKCADCGKLATWMYMPGDSDEGTEYCDNCVPRGCSCNEVNVNSRFFENGEEYIELPDNDMVEGHDWRWVEKDIRWEHLFEGKQIPCCEYWYFEEEIDKD